MKKKTKTKLVHHLPIHPVSQYRGNTHRQIYGITGITLGEAENRKHILLSTKASRRSDTCKQLRTVHLTGFTPGDRSRESKAGKSRFSLEAQEKPQTGALIGKGTKSTQEGCEVLPRQGSMNERTRHEANTANEG